MNRILSWVRSRSDHNVVSYSRFGLPGDELDDRTPPTVIHVAPFREDSPEFMAFGTHSQRAAVISAGVGLSLVLFVFLSVFFEFDWYHHEKGVDIGALGMYRFAGCKVFLGVEPMRRQSQKPTHGNLSEQRLLVFLELVEPVGVTQANDDFIGLFRCRNYLEKRQIHDLEMRVAEKSKLQHPGIRIVFGSGDPEMNSPSNNDLQPPADEAPPSYEHATQSANGTTQPEASAASQRTVLQAQDSIL
ncbi:unnamed protein product [Angiostrongylus costaricensis]|uniref:PHM7_ext domain-containing protein n=1 Tax=Angiostrongylus costaricensis TaxID=334426 RepID=A0A0R3PDR1_ANGCS|nr:unnamed protein product [Angiostrongylus costaricensis]